MRAEPNAARPRQASAARASATASGPARPRSGGQLEAPAGPDPGSHDLWVEGELMNATGEVVARARARWRIEIPAT